jgi:hypothetical protein
MFDGDGMVALRGAFQRFSALGDEECALLAYGFARARCGECGHDFLVAFSCKGRAVCPSCNTRRMAESAAHLLDHVLPPLPVRQWVLSLPKRLRYCLQNDREALNSALRIFLDEIERHLRAHSPGAGPQARAGAVAFIHRFGSSLNLHTHFHVCVIDGVFEPDLQGGIRFFAVDELDAGDAQSVQGRVRHRGAEMRVVAFITEAAPMQRILNHIAEPSTAPKIAPARGPPSWQEEDCATIFLEEERFAGDPLAQPQAHYEFDQRITW